MHSRAFLQQRPEESQINHASKIANNGSASFSSATLTIASFRDVDNGEYAEYAEYTEYAEYAEHAESVKYAEYAKYTKFANQTYQTKPAKPNLPNQIKLSLPSILNQTYQTKITGQSSQRLGP